jgi:hypothetical protein
MAKTTELEQTIKDEIGKAIREAIAQACHRIGKEIVDGYNLAARHGADQGVVIEALAETLTDCAVEITHPEASSYHGTDAA